MTQPVLGYLWQSCASRWACVVMFVFIFRRYLLREKPAKRIHSHYLRYVLTVCMWRNILSDIEDLVMVITFVAFMSWQSSSLILSLCLVALFSVCVLLTFSIILSVCVLLLYFMSWHFLSFSVCASVCILKWYRMVDRTFKSDCLSFPLLSMVDWAFKKITQFLGVCLFLKVKGYVTLLYFAGDSHDPCTERICAVGDRVATPAEWRISWWQEVQGANCDRLSPWWCGRWHVVIAQRRECFALAFGGFQRSVSIVRIYGVCQ